MTRDLHTLKKCLYIYINFLKRSSSGPTQFGNHDNQGTYRVSADDVIYLFKEKAVFELFGHILLGFKNKNYKHEINFTFYNFETFSTFFTFFF